MSSPTTSWRSNAGWDEEMLADELTGLLATELDFDIGVTGFSIAEIDSLIDGLRAGRSPAIPRDDRAAGGLGRTADHRPGDLWQLGPHRLICGDALDGRRPTTG